MSRLPKEHEINLEGCYIAGGAILSTVTKTEINDYDIYPKSNKAMIDAFYKLIEDESCFVVNISDRAVTFKSNNITNTKGERGIIQVMTYDTFETPEKIFENFDFTVCMGAFDCDTKEYHFHPDFFPDIASKTLRFNVNTRYPLNSLLRVTKYTAKGFFISKPEHIKMALAVIKQGMPHTWEELEAQIGGTYGREVKLRRDDMVFSFEAAVDMLSDMNSFLETDIADMADFDELNSAEKLELMFSDEPIKVLINSEGCYFSFDEETNSPTGVLKGKPRNPVIIENQRLTGYKILKPNADGTLKPGIYSYKPTVYEVGKETECTESPYLYVFPTLEAAKSRKEYSTKIFKVSYNVSDLRNARNREIQVTKMLVEELIQ